MRATICASLAVLSAVTWLGPPPARADLKITQKTVIQCPGISQMLREVPDEQRGPLLKMMSPMLTGAPWITTTYLKGSRMRTDMGDATLVVNSATGRALTINHQTHQYSVGAYDPFQASAGSFTCRITPTSESAPMLGHTVRRYLIEMTSSVLPKSQISGEIWAAPDLPTPPMTDLTSGAGVVFQKEMAKVKGMPLAYKLLYRNTPAGDIAVTSYATSLRDAPLMASVFQAPAGYRPGSTRTATNSPSAGFPLGDGMPLDSLSQVTNEMALGQSPSPADQGPIDLNKLIASASSGGTSESYGQPDGQGMSQALSGLTGGGNSGQRLGGMSSGEISQLLNSFTGGQTAAGGSGGDMSSLLNPQMLQQLNAELQSLLNDDG
ncbi:MAG TPA: hypothetical protein VFW40_04815, partial [Capsulimonadaceae bacterium]|nr:hypothetical protein [Capsulimonadaceae bacterium]